MTAGKAEGLPVLWLNSHKSLNGDLRDALRLRKRIFSCQEKRPSFALAKPSAEAAP
jgi:hypothetical protein